jgi:geranylgeranyl diphosphate synthase type I
MNRDRLSELLSSHRPLVEQALKDSFEIPSDRTLALYRMMHFQLGWIDESGEPQISDNERLYGCLCLESAYLFDSDLVEKAPIAAAVELLKESIQTHEDMQTANQYRYGRSAVWWLWGPAQSINVGDGLHALARLSLFTTEKSLQTESLLAAVGSLDSSALSYYEGQYIDLELQERIDVSVKEYMKMAKAKYGSLLGGALSLGAIASGAKPAEVQIMQKLGEAIGVASLVSEEIEAIWNPSRQSGRALNKSKLYPIVVGLEDAPLPQKRELGGYYFKRVMDIDDLAAIKAILESLGAKEKTELFVEEQKIYAKTLLQSLNLNSTATDRWNELIENLVGQK